MSRVPVAVIKDRLRQRMADLVAALAPGLRRHGAYWQGPNPTRSKDSGTSFTIYANGAWCEYDESDKPADVIDLIAYCKGLSPGEAIIWAKRFVGLDSVKPDEVRKISADAEKRRLRAEEAQKRARERKAQRAFEIWLHAKPIVPGDLVCQWLKSRAIDVAAIPFLERDDVRFAPALEHWRSAEYRRIGDREEKVKPGLLAPAMVWPIRMGAGAVRGVHCTFLSVLPDGRVTKLRGVEKGTERLVLGEKKGGVICLTRGPSNLTPAEAAAQGVKSPLSLFEGVETGLSFALANGADTRVWAAIDLGNFASAPFDHPCVSESYFGIENDVKMRAIAMRERVLDTIEERLGREPSLLEPPRGGDFNDTLMEDE